MQARPLARRFFSARPRLPEATVAALERVGCAVSRNPGVLAAHGKDESHHAPVPPDAVCFATSTDEVVAVVRLCAEARAPVIPFGAGTSLEGHLQALHGGVSLDLSAMDAVLAVDADDMDCRVQAGVKRHALNDHLRATGLQFMVDPGADASLGGMAACGASGTAAVKYGTMRENVLSTTCVLASGEVIRTGGRARKSSAGYDLTRLLVGSEGTLGVIVELGLRLHAVPTAAMAATCHFDSVRAAADAVVAMLQLGLPLARCELLDATTMRAFNAYNAPRALVAPLPERPSLFLEFHGLSDAAVEEQAALAREACVDGFGGAGFASARDDDERRKLWAARHATYYAALALRPDARGFVTDACVPITRLAEVMDATAADVAASGVIGPIFGHAGDGNFHCILNVRDDDPPAYLAAVHAVNDRLVRRTLAAGGTCTGEHGVGVGKRKYLEQQHGAGAVAAMRAVKLALDPHNLMNPGKVVCCGPPGREETDLTLY